MLKIYAGKAPVLQDSTKERLVRDQWLFASIANFELNANRVFIHGVFFAPGADTVAFSKNGG